MLRNHFKVALRNIIRDKSYTLINIIGLSTSMAIGLLVILFLIDHGSVDSHIPEVDKIYRVMTDILKPEKQRSRLHAYTPYQLKELVKGQGYPISAETSMKKVSGTVKIGEKALGFTGLSVTPEFLGFFNYGGQDTWLSQPRQVVLTMELSEKLFEKASDVVGQTLEVSGVGPCLITGIVEDLPRTHIDFELLVSMSSYPTPSANEPWLSADNRYVHYFKFPDQTSLSDIETYLSSLNEQLPTEARLLNHFKLQKVSEINLGDLVNDELSTTVPWFVAVFFQVLGLIVILSASFNFVALSLARSLKRAKEVGIRKVLGSAKRQIIVQFLIETQLLAFISLIVALAILSFLLPAFNDLKILRDIDGQITMDFSRNVSVYFAFALFAMAIGFVAGAYPAFYMSRFDSQAALRGMKEGGRRPFYLIRNGLLFVQFTFSVIFVMTTLVLNRQADQFVHTEYGFNHQELAFVSIEGYDQEQLRTELLQKSGVQSFTLSAALPSLNGISKVRASQPDMDANLNLEMISADENFLSTLGVQILAGQGFGDLGGFSRSDGLIINEVTLKALQYTGPEEAIGESIKVKLQSGTEETTEMKIIGVCRDFRHNFAMADIKGLIITYKPEDWEYAVINFGNSDRSTAEDQLTNVLTSVNASFPVEIEWFDITLANAYDEFYDIVHIFSFVSLLAIVIANLGQYGAVVQVINNRVKEIGIRKVLGSSYVSLMLLLSRNFILIMLAALLGGGAVGVWMNELWLSKIGEPINVDTSLVSISVVITIVTALLTVGWNVYKAAMLNPVESIRTD
ncbi:MAG: FtsX-like permease family protein [Cyclobacteriaceae bacterium]